MEEKTRRQTASPGALLREALGGPRQIAGKLARAGRTLRLLFDRPALEMRLRNLEAAGLIQVRPGTGQIVFGGLDMLRFVITPAARDYYRQREISFGFHVLLRFLDDPSSMIDPTGFRAAEGTFATLPGFLAYCNRLPAGWPTLLARLFRVHRFPVELAGGRAH